MINFVIYSPDINYTFIRFIIFPLSILMGNCWGADEVFFQIEKAKEAGE